MRPPPSSGTSAAAAAEVAAPETCVCSRPLPARPFNPFRHRAAFLWYHWLTVPLFGLLVFPLRLLLLLLCLAGAFLVSLATRLFGKPRPPLSPWRRFVADHILLNLGRAGAFVGGYTRIVVHGRRADVREAPVVVAAPHTSLVDTIAFFRLRPLLAPVVKAQGNPFYNEMLAAGEALTVHRVSRQARALAADELSQRARSGGRYAQLLTFPEGTCTNGRALIGFRTGAFAPGLPVQPLVLRHRDPLQLQCWAVDGPSMLGMIFRCGARLYSELHLDFLPVYQPSAEERANPQLFANNVRDLMARHASLGLSDQSHTDVLLFKAARRRGLPQLGFPLSGLRRFLRWRWGPLLSRAAGESRPPGLLEQLRPGPPELACPHELAARADGTAGAPPEPWMRLVFELFDRTGCGRIDARQLLISAALLRSPHQAAEILREAMTRLSCAYDASGLVDAAAMETALGGIVGLTAELRRAVMRAAPVAVSENGLATPESCLSHMMQFNEVANLLRLHADISDIIL